MRDDTFSVRFVKAAALLLIAVLSFTMLYGFFTSDKYKYPVYSYLDGNVDVDYPVGLEKLQYSKREWIAGAYDHILEKYGSFYRYFIACGLTPTEIRLVRRKLTGRRRRLCVL